MKSVLIADNDELVLEEIGVYLASYRIYPVKTGRTALEMARGLGPDLILLDTGLPDMNGFEVLDQLKAHPRLRHIPVILLVGGRDPALEVRALRSGAADVIEKPVDRDILYHRLELHLGLAEYALSLEHAVCELEDNLGLAFAELIEYKDYNFSGHVTRTSRYTELLALALYDERAFPGELTLGFAETLVRAAPFHDIGKIGISEEILRKEGPLDDEERRSVREHTVIGGRILDGIAGRVPGRDYLKTAALIARGHHERFDGSGYPSGLSGGDIPLGCRIVSVVNVYDACVSDRVYHPAMSHRDACAELERGRGTEFDPAALDVFLKHHARFARLGRELWAAEGRMEAFPALVNLKKGAER
ncbi:MAG: response regulator [Treponema sp.]|jgi:putative two-component system response regulator|nr:response regulator [Treponema sp.]